MILATSQCQHIFCCWVEPSLLLSSSLFGLEMNTEWNLAALQCNEFLQQIPFRKSVKSDAEEFSHLEMQQVWLGEVGWKSTKLHFVHWAQNQAPFAPIHSLVGSKLFLYLSITGFRILNIFRRPNILQWTMTHLILRSIVFRTHPDPLYVWKCKNVHYKFQISHLSCVEFWNSSKSGKISDFSTSVVYWNLIFLHMTNFFSTYI